MNEAGAAFKTCSCATVWQTREAFLSDTAVEIIGYSPHFRDLQLGWLHFNHHACRTTLAMPVDQFADLYAGPRFSDRKTGSADCPGYCLHEDELRVCPQQCECAWVRVIVGMITIWPKTVEESVV